MHPYLIEIFGIHLPTYGVLVATAFLSAVALTGRLARRAGADPERVTNLAIYCAVAGIAGAKLMMIAVNWRDYASHPGDLFSLSTLQAAGIFYGGLVAALIVAWLYMRRQGMPVLASADFFAPGLALGHAIGRLGCFAAGCCWGKQCDLPWAVVYTSLNANALVGVPLGVKVHPTQIYESLAELAIFIFLLARALRPHRAGSQIGLYLVLYSIVRFLVDYVRNQEQANPFGGPFTTAQWISLGLIAVTVAVWRVSMARAVQEKK